MDNMARHSWVHCVPLSEPLVKVILPVVRNIRASHRSLVLCKASRLVTTLWPIVPLFNDVSAACADKLAAALVPRARIFCGVTKCTSSIVDAFEMHL